MKVKIKSMEGVKVIEVKEGARVRDVVKLAGMSIEGVIVMKGNNVVLDEEVVKDGDELRIIKIVSSG
ncbi:MAG TPA: thiamine biosynthesis protein ThiS [Candidatus Aenigmarchaeota archaeon]|nr:thiamine biosynthesis protein ThiS [Candidatus Aenigmarchaeota archaeon]